MQPGRRRWEEIVIGVATLTLAGALRIYLDPFEPIRGLRYGEDYCHVYSTGPHARPNPSWSHFFFICEPFDVVEKRLTRAWPRYRRLANGKLAFDVPFEHLAGEPTLSVDSPGRSCVLEVPIPDEPPMYVRAWVLLKPGYPRQ